VSDSSDRSNRRKSRLGRKEYPVGKPVAPPPGWVPPVAPAPPITAAPLPPSPPVTWVPPAPQAPLVPTPLWNAPAAPVEQASVVDSSPPVLLTPNDAPMWAPLGREAEPSREMTYNLLEPPSSEPPVSFGPGPEFLTPPAKIGLAVIGALLLLGAGLFVFHGGMPPKKDWSETSVAESHDEERPAEPRLTAAPIQAAPKPVPPSPRTPDPVETAVEKPDKPVPEPEPTPEPPAKPVTKKPPQPPPTVGGDPALGVLMFEKDVLPIFKAKCIACHGSRKRGGVDIRSVDALVASGEADGVLVRGSITKSKLWRAIDSNKMPKAGPKLTAEEKELIRRWIMAGAKSTPKSSPPPLP
jgi:hypothetical protein